MSQNDLIQNAGGSVFSAINILAFLPKIINEYTLESANVQNFIKSTGHHFDVIVAEDFYSDSLLMFAHKFNAPVVTICMFSIHLSLLYKHKHVLLIYLILFHPKKVHLELRILLSVNKV